MFIYISKIHMLSINRTYITPRRIGSEYYESRLFNDSHSSSEETTIARSPYCMAASHIPIQLYYPKLDQPPSAATTRAPKTQPLQPHTGLRGRRSASRDLRHRPSRSMPHFAEDRRKPLPFHGAFVDTLKERAVSDSFTLTFRSRCPHFDGCEHEDRRTPLSKANGGGLAMSYVIDNGFPRQFSLSSRSPLTYCTLSCVYVRDHNRDDGDSGRSE